MRFRFLLILLLFLLFAIPVSAQSPPPEMTLELAWEEWFAAPGWVEVQVTLTNENSNWEGELRLLDTTNQVTYRQSLVLPAHSRKFYRIPVFAPNPQTLRVALSNATGDAESVQDIVLYNTGDKRLCAVADMTGLIKAQMLKECGATLLIQDLARLPETAMAWDVLSVLILNGVSTSDLTPAQQEALLAWVAAGGRLILSGGGALPQTLSGLPQSLQIATPGAIQVFDGLTLSGQTFDGASGGALTLSASATPLVTVAGSHLAAFQMLGRGEVDVVSWDIVQTPSLEWLQALWAADPIPAVHIPLAQDVAAASSSYGDAPMAYSLLQMSQDAVPGLRQWLLLLPFYILVMGPGTWFVVRRLRRPSLAWVIIPGWIVFSLIVLALALNGQFSQVFPLTHQVAHIFVPGNALPARVVQGAAMYAPRTQKLSWEMDGASRWLLGNYTFGDGYYGSSGSAYPLEIRYQEDADRMETARALGVITWGTEGLTTIPPLTVDFQITVEGRTKPVLIGTLRSELALSDVALFLGDGRYVAELTRDLAQGVVLEVNQPLTQTEPTYTDFNRVCRGSNYFNPYAMTSLSASSSNPDVYTAQLRDKPCYIAGMTKDVPFPILNNKGTQVVESCILFTVPCPVQAHGDMEVTLQPVTTRVEDGWMDETNTIYVSSVGATVPFVIPSYLQLKSIQNMTIDIQPSSWQSGPPFDPKTVVKELLLWDWENEDWVEQSLPDDSTKIILTAAQAERFYNMESGLKVRIKPKDSAGTNIILVIDIKGSW